MILSGFAVLFYGTIIASNCPVSASARFRNTRGPLLTIVFTNSVLRTTIRTAEKARQK